MRDELRAATLDAKIKAGTATPEEEAEFWRIPLYVIGASGRVVIITTRRRMTEEEYERKVQPKLPSEKEPNP